MNSKKKRILLIFGATVLVLLIPVVAMQFTSEVRWGPGDFFVAGILLFGAGILTDLVLRKIKSKSMKTFVLAFIVIAMILVWVELAVGIFGTPFAGD